MNIQNVAVLGAGTMGRGIAQWFAQIGCNVYLSDLQEEAVTTSLNRIQQQWQKLAERKKFSPEEIQTFENHLHKGGKDRTPWKKLDLVIEAVVEDLAIKTKLFQSLPPSLSCILASNTSSLSIGKLAASLPPSHRTHLLGLHFFNPAPIMKLVEVVAGPESDLKMCEELAAWFRQKNKIPALCQDQPGFIVNRVARNFYGEALRVVGHNQEKNCHKIDEIMRAVGGFRMGPFELMDLIGVDVNYHVTCSIWEAFDRHPRFEPHPLQKELVARGHLGKKSGKGFYS